jgi:hypothetical protein
LPLTKNYPKQLGHLFGADQNQRQNAPSTFKKQLDKLITGGMNRIEKAEFR